MLKIIRFIRHGNIGKCQNLVACAGSPWPQTHRNLSDNNSFLMHYRDFSVKSSVESMVGTQSGIFETLSKSTPVTYCQEFLVQVHNYTGLPWWASILVSTVLLRSVITLPVAVYQQVIIARLENIKLELPAIAEELKHETNTAVKIYKWDEKTAKIIFRKSMKKQWNKLIERDNCHPLKTTVLLWFQIPLWVSLSVSIRNLVYMLPEVDVKAQLTFTELMVGGFGFIPNLTIPDSSWIFPVALGILNLAIIELQVLSKAPDLQTKKVQKIFTNIFRGLSVLMVPIAASVPSCLVLYWTTSSAFGLMQNLLLMAPKVKRILKIPKSAAEVDKPYNMVISNFKSKFKLM
ncbi:cytochrome c oxidase assembly protein COX18, mitochondrial [Euwallacea fornicatus]|uniref:cytochrome c oxidase assembly protein COX18, mitochondrial n=1 Tax=Euwallacea fornicatus TaxID=995702 RepID=UPI00338E050B